MDPGYLNLNIDVGGGCVDSVNWVKRSESGAVCLNVEAVSEIDVKYMIYVTFGVCALARLIYHLCVLIAD